MTDYVMKEREFYIDVLRVLAMVAVIFNHSFGYFSCDNWERYFNTGIYFADNTLNAMTRFNVPIFIMISGALLLQNRKNADIRYIWKERIKNVLIPFATWSVIYIIANCYRGGVKKLTEECFKAVIVPRHYSYHLWYMYMLVLLYAVTPLLFSIANMGKRYLDYFLIIWIVFSVIYPFVNHICPQIELKGYQNYNVAGGYVGYYLLGYRLSICKRKISSKVCLFIFVCTWVITALGSIVYQNYLGNYDGYLFGFLSPNIMAMSISLFLLVKNNVKEKGVPECWKAIILQLSKLSFGIYFIHFMVRDLFKELMENGYIADYLYIILSPLIVFAVSTATINIASKFRLLKLPIAGIVK